MRLTYALQLAAWASVAAAHGDGEHAPPGLLGARKFLSDLDGKGALRHRQGNLQAARGRSQSQLGAAVERIQGGVGASDSVNKRALDERANTDDQCGQGYGSCAAGYCCSSAGWCGLGKDYCAAPDCQINYGPGCDGNQKPSGADTSNIARTQVGSVAYGGAGIYDCVNPGDVALTFDDGPYNYTNDLLDKFQKYNATATFFITGNNLGKGMINDKTLPWVSVIQRMAAEGHQIASHTWSHQNFSQLNTTQARNAMIYNEIAFNSILGYIPTYMRPPYSICESACQSMLSTLGYHVIYFDLDTQGYLDDSATLIQKSKDIWDAAINPSNSCTDSFLQIEHDIHYQTVYNLTDYVLASLYSHGYRSVTVGECLGDDPANWYRAGSAAVPAYTFASRPQPTVSSCSTAASSSGTGTSSIKVSTDATCGNGTTCQDSGFGNCCSVNGWCGSTSDYCGTGCQTDFGSGCSAAAAASSSSSSPSSTQSTTTNAASSTQKSTTTPSAASASGTSSSLKVSTDATCGNGVTCQGSSFGNCCSVNGWCGTTSDYCGTGCQPSFGSGCSAVASSTAASSSTQKSTTTATTSTTSIKQAVASSPSATSTSTTQKSTPATTAAAVTTSSTKTSTSTSTSKTSTTAATSTALVASTNGRCGASTGMTCKGSSSGGCCTSSGKCSTKTCLSASLSGCQAAYSSCYF